MAHPFCGSQAFIRCCRRMALSVLVTARAPCPGQGLGLTKDSGSRGLLSEYEGRATCRSVRHPLARAAIKLPLQHPRLSLRLRLGCPTEGVPCVTASDTLREGPPSYVILALLLSMQRSPRQCGKPLKLGGRMVGLVEWWSELMMVTRPRGRYFLGESTILTIFSSAVGPGKVMGLA